MNEYPGRDLGIFVSVGTGKRPPGTNSNQHEWWEGFIGGSVGSFADARRRLIAKIEGCEDTHNQMLSQELPKYRIPAENYARLNVEVGVGEFGMNEWDRLSDMTLGTRRYLKKEETQDIIQNASYRLAKIHLMHRRMTQQMRPPSWIEPNNNLDSITELQQPWPAAVELPAEPVPGQSYQGRTPISQPQMHFRNPSNPPYPDDQSYSSRRSSNEKFTVLDPSSAGNGGGGSSGQSRISYDSARHPNDKFSVASSADYQTHEAGAPPRPPKTPINDPVSAGTVISPISNSSVRLSNTPSYGPQSQSQGPGQIHIHNNRLPYPDDGPPPVNKLRKPQYTPS